MMKTLLIHTPENYTSVSSLTEPKAVQESMEKHETSYFETSVLTHARKRFMWLLFLMLSATVTGTIITRYENAFLLRSSNLSQFFHAAEKQSSK